MSELEARAAAGALDTIREVGESSREHLARMAWLNGYMAGHTDATQSAIRVIQDASPFKEPVHLLPPGELDPRD